VSVSGLLLREEDGLGFFCSGEEKEIAPLSKGVKESATSRWRGGTGKRKKGRGVAEPYCLASIGVVESAVQKDVIPIRGEKWRGRGVHKCQRRGGSKRERRGEKERTLCEDGFKKSRGETPDPFETSKVRGGT